MGLAGLPARHRRRRDLPALDDVGLGLDAVGRGALADRRPRRRLADGHPAHDAEQAGWSASATPGPSCSATSRCWSRSSSGTTSSRRSSCRCARCRASCWSCFALGFFTSARIAEQVRAGIQSLPKGQRYAGLAIGLTLPQTYRYVLLADGLSDHHPAAHQRVDEHHQEHLGGVRGVDRRADDVRACRRRKRPRAASRSTSR